MMSDHAARELYLDDIAVGDEFVSAEHQLDAAQIIAFASQFDPQPFHLDDEAAQASFFQGLAASGWHTTAITMRLLVQSLPFASGLIGAGANVTWPQPTRPGDILHVRSRIINITPSRSKPDRAIVEARSLTYAQDGQIRQDLTARLLAFKRANS
ncbi:MaoC family dehydratase [Acidocella aromatica]|uniref:Acyl dehydratase n=1 Tax=Acidocella aromatica TaxID=1303579 RepID=A0A840VBG2_9PROT|nr:MaoC family dehydratase [Acidocella aromatica]MBB5373113.1 acyl dehydratase [Acidocella aromatica]